MMNKAGTTSTASKPAGLKPSQKDNKVPVKKDVKSDPVKAPVKKPAASKSTTTTQVPAPLQEIPNTDNNPEFTKPTELRFEFIQAIQAKEYEKALSLAEEIKKIEPNNVLITHFQEFLNQNIESLKAEEEEEEEEEEGEEGEEDEDENEDEDEDEDEKDEDEDEDEDEEEDENENENEIEEQDRDEQNKSIASTAAQSERSKIGE